MSYSAVPATPKVRPGTVSAACNLLYATAALELVSVAIALLAYGPTHDVYQRMYAGTDAEGMMGTAMTVGIGVGVGIDVLFAAGLVVLAALNARGKNPARITTWVVAGLGVLCTGCGLAGNAAGGALTGLGQGQNAANMPDPAEVQRQVSAAIPAWQSVASMAITVLVLLALIMVIVLLALPASNRYFRTEQEVWVPPAYPTGTPGYPGGPSGYPMQPGPSGLPTYPTSEPGSPQGGSGSYPDESGR